MTETPSEKGSAVVAWFARRSRWQRILLAAVLGASLTLGHAPVSIPWVVFLALPPLVLLLHTAKGGWSAAWTGWAAAFGYFVTGLHWMGHAFLVDPERYGWLLIPGVTALPAFLGLFWALAFWLAWRVRGARPVGTALVLAGLLTLAEFARSNILTGFPWALPAYVWGDLPPMQLVAWIGPFGLTLATLFIGSLPGLAVVRGTAVAAVLALGAGGVIWAVGFVRVPAEIAYAADAPVIRVVQPNAPQHLKWAPGHRETYYQRLIDATGQPADGQLGPPDAVLWPEASVYYVPAATPTEVARISAAAGSAWVLLGAVHGEVTADGDRWTNALVTISPDGKIGPRYDKHHLVPFGEYLPFRPIFDALGVSQFAIRGDLQPGPGPRTMTIGALPPFSPLICYEAIFPNDVVGDTRPAWLVQPTNDAWFGNWAGPFQHYVQARFRAVEQGLPIVRAANTGISALVGPHGREVEAIGLDRYAHFDARLPSPLPATLYARTGDWVAVILCVLFALSAFAVGRTRA